MGRLRDGFAAVAVAAGLGAGALCLPATPALATDSGATQPMYRLYNPNSGEHFYTKNGAERDMLVGLDWRSEGTGWTSLSDATPLEGWKITSNEKTLHMFDYCADGIKTPSWYEG